MAQKQAARSGWFRSFRDFPVVAADLTANGAVTFYKFVPGFPCVVEEFGYVGDVVATGAGAALIFQLTDVGTNVIAQLTLTTANVVTGKARGDFASTSAYTVSGDGIRPDFRELTDTSTLQLKRVSGTALTAGSGRFWVKLRSRPSQVS
jgi:hypothetical protein